MGTEIAAVFLVGAVLAGADLAGADFAPAVLTGAVLAGAVLAGADLIAAAFFVIVCLAVAALFAARFALDVAGAGFLATLFFAGAAFLAAAFFAAAFFAAAFFATAFLPGAFFVGAALVAGAAFLTEPDFLAELFVAEFFLAALVFAAVRLDFDALFVAVFVAAFVVARFAAGLLAPRGFAAAVRGAAFRVVAFVAARLGVVRAVTLRELEVAAADTRLLPLPAESGRGALDGREARPLRPSAAITVDHPSIDRAHPQANRVGRSVCRQRRFEVLTCVRKAANYMGRSTRFPIAAPGRPVRRYHWHRDDEDE